MGEGGRKGEREGVREGGKDEEKVNKRRKRIRGYEKVGQKGRTRGR